MEKKTKTLKEIVFVIIGGIIILIAIGALAYDKLFYKPEIKIYSTSELRVLKQTLIERYGSLENIPEAEDPCTGAGSGHSLDNCW